MRKYDKKNKRNIAIILVISALIIIMFSLVIKLFLSTDKNEYKVSSGTIVFDKDKTIIKLKDDGVIKQKWNKEYYLIYNKENIELGDSAIAYDETSGQLHLYGKYYEISSGDEIDITSGETVIKNTASTKFYKLSDRKYLVVDKEIKSSDGLLSTSDFLMVDLDKVGNAALTNHKISLKTFAETVIVTSNYTFDIASEILTYGSDKIDLKKIIGSSNTFTKDDLVPEEGNSTGGEGTGSSEGNTADDEKTTDKAGTDDSGKTAKEKVLVENAKRESKKTSIVSVTGTVNKVMVDYVIYDPYKEYTSVYMEFKEINSNNVDTIYLKNDSTSYEISKGILPNTEYKLTLYVTYLENGDIVTDEIESRNVTTKKPNIDIAVSRITTNQVNYSITKEYGSNFTGATLKVINTSNDNVLYNGAIDISGTMPTGSISLNDANITNGDIIKLVLTDIKVNGSIVKDLETSTKVRY